MSEEGTAIAENTNTETSDWRSSLPEDLKSDPILERFKTPESLAKSYTHLHRMSSKDPDRLLEIPKEDKEWDALYAKLGRPEKAEEYKFDALPEGTKTDERLLDWFKKTVHASGFTQKQAGQFYNAYNQMVSQMNQEYMIADENQRKEAESVLRQKWGQNYDKELEKANDAIRRFKAEGLLKELGLDNDPRIAGLFNEIGSLISEDKPAGPAKSVLDKPTIQGKLDEIMNHPAMMDRSHPQHKFVVEEKTRLVGLLNSLS